MNKLAKRIIKLVSVSFAFLAISVAVFASSNGAYAKTIDIDTAEYGYGKYLIHVRGVGERGVFDEDTVVFYYVPVVVTVVDDEQNDEHYLEFDYATTEDGEDDDDSVAEVIVNIYDESGNLITPLSPIRVTPPQDRIELPLDDYDLPAGTYTIIATALNADGDELYKPFTTTFYYGGREDIDVPDTGGFLQTLNIAKSDYMITGLIIFGIAAVAGVFFILKVDKKKTSSKSKKR